MEEKHYREYAEKAIRVIRTTTERRNRRIKRKYFSQFYRICPRMDRYIIGKFIGTYFFAIALIISLAIVFDFNENLSKFTQYNAPWKAIVFDYYLNFIPYFANLFSPLFVFIAVIFFTSKMAGNSEIISILAAGVSFKRLMVPYMVSCVFISILSYTLAAYVIPHGTVIRQNFESMYKNNKKNTSAENVQLQVDRGVIAYMQHYDNVFKKGYGFCLDKFENKKLVSHMTASEIQYDTISDSKYHWKATNWKIREFSKGQQETFTSPQLSEYISKQIDRGSQNVVQYQVEYHKRIASSFASFILTIIGASLSSRKRKGGMGMYLGLGLALSFLYIMLQTISSTFAINAGTSPILAAWVPNILFGIVAYFCYRHAPN